MTCTGQRSEKEQLTCLQTPYILDANAYLQVERHLLRSCLVNERLHHHGDSFPTYRLRWTQQILYSQGDTLLWNKINIFTLSQPVFFFLYGDISVYLNACKLCFIYYIVSSKMYIFVPSICTVRVQIHAILSSKVISDSNIGEPDTNDFRKWWTFSWTMVLKIQLKLQCGHS